VFSIIDWIRFIWRRFKRYRFIVNAGAYISSNILLQAAGFLLTPLWARFLTPSDYGITGTLSAYSGVLSTLLMMSLHGAVTRHYYDYMDDTEGQKSYVTSVTLFQMLVSGVIVFLLNLWGPTLWARFTTGKIPFDPYVRLVLLSSCISTWIMIPQALYQAQQKARNYVYVGYGRYLLGVLANLILVVVLRQGAYGKLLGQLVSGALVAAVVLSLAWRRWFTPHIEWKHIRDGLAFSLPLVPHLVAAWALQAADRVILERFVSLDEMGLYNFGYTLGMVMSFLVTGINQAWAPYYYRLMENNPNPKKKVIQVVSIYVALIGGICLVGVLFAGEIVHILLPPNYYGVVPYIAPVLLGYLMQGLYYFSVLPIFYHKKTKMMPFLTGTAAVASILLNICLVPHYGAIASAWITMITYVLFFVLAFFVGRRYEKMDYPLGRYFIPVSIILFSTLAVTRLSVFDFWSLVVKVGFLVIYSIMAFLLLIRPYMENKWWREMFVKI
jgi:O-antigen/teichoic acid export membrane protein